MNFWLIGETTADSEALVEHLQTSGAAVHRVDSALEITPGHPSLLSAGLILTATKDCLSLRERLSSSVLPPIFALSSDKPSGKDSLCCRFIDPKDSLDTQQTALLEGFLPTPCSTVRVNRLVLERDTHTTTFEGRIVDLTHLEFEILWMLAEQAGRVVSSTRLLSQVWGLQHDPQSNRVAVYVKRLRTKLPGGLIQTQRGKGYRLQV